MYSRMETCVKCKKLISLCVNTYNIHNDKSVIIDRREKVWILLTRGMRVYQIAKELKVDKSTISRDIQYLTAESQNFLNKLAKDSLPMMYQISIDGFKAILQECWKIYQLP